MVLMEIIVTMCNGSSVRRCEPGMGIYLKFSVRYVAVDTDLDPLSYLLSSIGGIIPKMIPQLIPVHLAV